MVNTVDDMEADRVSSFVEVVQSSSPVVKSKRKYTSRHNLPWKEVAEHLMLYRNYNATIEHFKLLSVNSNYASWYSILRRWVEKYKSKNYSRK